MLLRLGLRPGLRRGGGPSKRWCGIVAALEFGEERVDRTRAATILRACEKLRHRGPDGQGFVGSSLKASTRWALGHTRLAIVAPNEIAAAQPFHLRASDGAIGSAIEVTHEFEDREMEDEKTIALAANGEIYTHKSLLSDLEGSATSHSDCEVIAHLYVEKGAAEAAKRLTDAGMFAFVLIDARGESPKVFAARDPVGIKPLYYGLDSKGRVAGFASELKSLLTLPGLVRFEEFPAGHFYADGEFQQYYDPAWKRNTIDVDIEESKAQILVKEALDKAVDKRMMTDVDFGLFLSGGIDSCIIGQLMVKRCRDLYGPDFRPKSFTVGMADSPDLMAARAMAKELKTDHYERLFTAAEAISMIEKVVYHIETYNAELIRSAVPNYFLAELASTHVKMVLTGEGADELYAGYAYFKDAPSPDSVHKELCRIYSHLGVANLLRTDRMTMAHSLEARVPFLDIFHTTTAFTKVSPSFKYTAGTKGPNGEPGEKRFLRRSFEATHGGITIPRPLLYRAKAMQCEGVGEDWVSILQRALSDRVSDSDFQNAASRFPLETPQSKEEYFYRDVFEKHYPNCQHVPTPWEGGCRAAGADFKSDTYTRFGLNDVSRLTHAYQSKKKNNLAAAAA